MAVSYYDEALYKKITSWFKKDKNSVKILKPEETLRMLQVKGDIKNDKPLTLPFIAISREPNIAILYTNKKPMSFDGLVVKQNENKSQPINGIPISINYQIDIYTKMYEQADAYVREFVFHLINHPRLEIEIPYNNIKYIHESNVRLNSPIQDNSDIPQRLYSGEFTRWTITITIDDAYLFSSPIEDNISIEGDLEIEGEGS